MVWNNSRVHTKENILAGKFVGLNENAYFCKQIKKKT